MVNKIQVEFKSSSNNKTIEFLNYSSHNYISARILYLHGHVYDAGFLAHEALEKVLKSLIFFNDDSMRLKSHHNLHELKNILQNDYDYRLEDYKEPFKYYEYCYAYRYPNNKKPKSFSTGTLYFKALDRIFKNFHDLCLKKIEEDKCRYKSGIYYECTSYFKSEDENELVNILHSNDFFTRGYVDKAKEFWHDNGFYKKDKNGLIKDPFGGTIKHH